MKLFSMSAFLVSKGYMNRHVTTSLSLTFSGFTLTSEYRLKHLDLLLGCGCRLDVHGGEEEGPGNIGSLHLLWTGWLPQSQVGGKPRETKSDTTKRTQVKELLHASS